MQDLMPLSRRASLNQSALAIVLEPMADDGSIALVAQQPVRTGQAAQEGQRPGVVAHLAGCQEEPDRPSFGVGHSVQLGVQPALRAPDEPTAPPFLARRLEAVRCALRKVASIMIVLGASASAARPAIIRAKTPMPLHRFQRL